MKIQNEVLSIFQILASERTPVIQIINTFEADGTNFYMCKFTIDSPDDGGETTLYGCYFDGYDKALILESELGAKIAAACDYQKVTGKKLPKS